MSNLKARVDSGFEPGTLTYRQFRYGDTFTVFEEYVHVHLSSTIQSIISFALYGGYFYRFKDLEALTKCVIPSNYIM